MRGVLGKYLVNGEEDLDFCSFSPQSLYSGSNENQSEPLAGPNGMAAQGGAWLPLTWTAAPCREFGLFLALVAYRATLYDTWLRLIDTGGRSL